MFSKNRILLFFFIFITINAFAQNPNRGEIGIFGGGAYYLGDVNKIPFLKTKPSFGAFFRHSIDTRFNLTGSFIYANISGSDADNKNAYYVSRNQSFNHSIYGLTSKIEFNFIPYIAGDEKKKYSPYAFAGLAFSYTYSKYLFSVPFGVGYKYNLTKNFILGAEYTMYKTFSDRLDFGIITFPDDPNTKLDESLKQTNYAATSDWYSIFGIYFAYKIKYRMKCPAFD